MLKAVRAGAPASASAGESALLAQYGAHAAEGEPRPSDAIPLEPADLQPVDEAPEQPIPLEVLKRRKNARAPFVATVRLELTDGTTIDASAEDISEGGLLVVTHIAIANGEQVTARFDVPGRGDRVTLPCVVKWARAARRLTAVGLEILSPPDDVCAAISRYVARAG
jgi:hypothetical protein